MAVQGMTESLAGLNMSNDKTADYKKLIEYGLDAKVADKLDEIYKVYGVHCGIKYVKYLFCRRKS